MGLDPKWAAKLGLDGPAPAKPSKYRAVPTVVDGIRFASKKEAEHWQRLVLLEKAGAIQNLQRQVRFRLDVNGVHVAVYIADFTYVDGGRLVVADAKGVAVPVYKLKKKLMLAIHGIRIQEM